MICVQSTRIRDFDDRFVAKQFGYASWREYYAAASMDQRTHLVQVPLLTLNAEDDPFAPAHCELLNYFNNTCNRLKRADFKNFFCKYQRSYKSD